MQSHKQSNVFIKSFLLLSYFNIVKVPSRILSCWIVRANSVSMFQTVFRAASNIIFEKDLFLNIQCSSEKCGRHQSMEFMLICQLTNMFNGIHVPRNKWFSKINMVPFPCEPILPTNSFCPWVARLLRMSFFRKNEKWTAYTAAVYGQLRVSPDIGCNSMHSGCDSPRVPFRVYRNSSWERAKPFFISIV